MDKDELNICIPESNSDDYRMFHVGQRTPTFGKFSFQVQLFTSQSTLLTENLNSQLWRSPSELISEKFSSIIINILGEEHKIKEIILSSPCWHQNEP